MVQSIEINWKMFDQSTAFWWHVWWSMKGQPDSHWDVEPDPKLNWIGGFFKHVFVWKSLAKWVENNTSQSYGGSKDWSILVDLFVDCPLFSNSISPFIHDSQWFHEMPQQTRTCVLNRRCKTSCYNACTNVQRLLGRHSPFNGRIQFSGKNSMRHKDAAELHL